MPRDRTNTSPLLNEIDPRDFADTLRKAIEIRGDDECWPFVGVTGRSTVQQHNRYGQINLGTKYSGFRITAPRAMLMLVLGRVLRPAMVVCHLCHWKPCCNPHHLVEGTETFNASTTPLEVKQRGGLNNRGVPKKQGTGEKQRVAQLTSRMRHCECRYSVNAGTMAGHLKQTGHRLI